MQCCACYFVDQAVLNGSFCSLNNCVSMAFLRLTLMSFFLACVTWSTTPLLALMVFMLFFAVYYCYVGLLCWNSCCWSGFDASTCNLSYIAGLFALLLLLEWLLLLLSTACASCIADLYAAYL